MQNVLTRLVALTLLSGFGVASYGQDVRATVTGQVSDPSGAPILGATITVTDVSRNASVTTETNASGIYVTPYLVPGTYTLTAEVEGFKRFVRENIELQAQDRTRVDVVLELGQVTDSVTVTDSVSQLETETASRSQVINSEMMKNIPTQGRNPFQLAWSAPGVIKQGRWRYLRSFDRAGMSNFSVNGGRNKENEVLIDGISNVRGNRDVIQSPTMETVQEFKIITNIYDAQYGRTGGGVVSIVTRGGSNQLHGNLFEYFQSEELNANQSELNRVGTPKPPMNINTYGFTASGPVVIPKVFDGRNKLFWLISYEAMKQRSADPGAATFPLQEWRQGDFSTLQNTAGLPVTIYDPLTTAADGTRTPFLNNQLPQSRMDPISIQALSYMPGPNSPGSGPAHFNNYIYPSRWVADMDQWSGRMDFQPTDKNRFYFRYGQNPFSEYRALVWGGSNVAEPTGNAPLNRNGRTLTFDWTSTLSPSATFNLRTGLARWEESSGNSFGANYDPRQLGFADALVSQFTQYQFPRFELGTYQAIGSSSLRNSGAYDTYTIQPNLSLVHGRHFIKTGVELRRYNRNTQNPGLASGLYQFDRDWTQALATQATANSGNEIATFLLGFPTAAYVDQNINPSLTNNYYATFVQDDWKVSSRLTINAGVRWDYEAPLRERYNRMLRGFGFDQPSPLNNSVSGLNLMGGIYFAGVDGQPVTAFNPDKNNFQPRIGAAYRVTNKWVVRGGYGLYYLGQDESGSNQGFSQRTNAIVSQDGNFTPAVHLQNAFANLPGGRLIAPIGSSEGFGSFIGQNVTVNYLDRPLPYSHQFSFDIERELPGGLLAEVAYVANLTRKFPVSISNVNVIPSAEMGRRTATGAIDTAYYNEQIPNPMAGLIPNNASLNGNTIARQFLLRPYPQYGNIQLQNAPIGRQRYDSAQFKLTKRYANGLTFLASYVIGKTLEQANVYNNQDFVIGDAAATRLERRSAAEIDIPQKFSLTGVWELPVGKGKAFGGDMNRAADLLLGGWQLNWNVTYSKGWTVNYPNALQAVTGSAKLDGLGPNYEIWDTSLWNGPDGKRVSALSPFELRTFQSRFGDVRTPGYQNWDASLAKFFEINERVRLQFRFEMVNALNHPWFSNPSGSATNVSSAQFGTLQPTQDNLPRFIKLGLNLRW
ncbi:MAG: TonB-dependent receptor plug domain-containing protein [Acidobacteria bacterium]|nr:TonB-dependent receptor plug domain-containing protein [Acidobacteriota bacterium]